MLCGDLSVFAAQGAALDQVDDRGGDPIEREDGVDVVLRDGAPGRP